MVMFVVLREGAVLDDRLTAEIKRAIREDCSPRHVPNELIAIDEVPRTLSGKVLEVPVKRILMGVSPAGRQRRLAGQPRLAAAVRGAGRPAGALSAPQTACRWCAGGAPPARAGDVSRVAAGVRCADVE